MAAAKLYGITNQAVGIAYRALYPDSLRHRGRRPIAVAAALGIALTACVDAPAPMPRVRVLTNVDAAQDEVVLYASAWREVGFAFSPGDRGPECARHWYELGEVDCQITIGFVAELDLEAQTGVVAFADRANRIAHYDAGIAGFTLCIAVAHEAGHILLNSGEHTIGGVMGSADCSLHDVDRELACRAVGACR